MTALIRLSAARMVTCESEEPPPQLMRSAVLGKSPCKAQALAEYHRPGASAAAIALAHAHWRRDYNEVDRTAESGASRPSRFAVQHRQHARRSCQSTPNCQRDHLTSNPDAFPNTATAEGGRSMLDLPVEG